MIAWNEISKPAYIKSVNCPVTVEKWNQNYVFQVMPNTWQTSSEECKAYASEECNKYRPDHKHCYNKTIEEEDLERYNWFLYLFLCRLCRKWISSKPSLPCLVWHKLFELSIPDFEKGRNILSTAWVNLKNSGLCYAGNKS